MKPLSGLKILSLEQFAAGPYGSKYLADMGAQVIKIENKDTGGDPARQIGPYFLNKNTSHAFEGWNANKQSLFLNMKSAADRAIFEELVIGADAVVNNLRGDQPGKLKLAYKHLQEINPKIVCLHISAYGRENTREAWPGYDYLMQAESGLMDITGDPKGDPTRSGTSFIDYMTGLTGMLGLLAAVRQADKTGVGCDVDVSLFDVALHQLSYVSNWYLNEGYAATRVPRGAHQSVTPVQTFKAKDGWIYVMCMTDKFWESLLDIIKKPSISNDLRFQTNKLRTENRDQLTETLDAAFSEHPVSYWLEALKGVLPVSPVFDVKQALDNPFLSEIDAIQHVPHPDRKDFRLLANPIKFNNKRLTQKVSSNFDTAE